MTDWRNAYALWQERLSRLAQPLLETSANRGGALGGLAKPLTWLWNELTGGLPISFLWVCVRDVQAARRRAGQRALRPFPLERGRLVVPLLIGCELSHTFLRKVLPKPFRKSSHR